MAQLQLFPPTPAHRHAAPAQVGDPAAPRLRASRVPIYQHFMVILLDRKNAPIGINTVSIGSLTASVVHPREVLKPAILANTASFICGHNHPSGDPAPSREDRALTQRLVEAGKLLGIALVDHIILGDGTITYCSFADQGLL